MEGVFVLREAVLKAWLLVRRGRRDETVSENGGYGQEQHGMDGYQAAPKTWSPRRQSRADLMSANFFSRP